MSRATCSIINRHRIADPPGSLLIHASPRYVSIPLKNIKRISVGPYWSPGHDGRAKGFTGILVDKVDGSQKVIPVKLLSDDPRMVVEKLNTALTRA